MKTLVLTKPLRFTSSFARHFTAQAGHRFPHYGESSWHEKKNGSAELFLRGYGWRTLRKTQFKIEEIPDLPESFNDDQFRAYAETYGVLCAQTFLSCADICKPTWAYRIITRHNPGYPSETVCLWFKSIFGADPTTLGDKLLLAVTDTYIFDTLAFENLLVRYHRYPKDADGSIADFVAAKWGPEVREYLERHLLKRKQEAA